MGFSGLMGKKIFAAFISADKDWLVFRTNEGDLGFYAEGECCSNSWFEHIENVPALVGGTVRGVEELDMPDAAESDDERIQCYGFVLKTEKGTIQIEMRNSSNGYYGGSVEQLDPAGGRRHTPAPPLLDLVADF